MKTKTCGLCHESIEQYDDSSIDHIIPKSKGGNDGIQNLQITHRWCNNEKDNLLPWQYRFFKFLNKHLFKVKKGRIKKGPK